MNLTKILSEGTIIHSSGTTGPSKPIYQPVSKIKAANKIARDVQEINKKSKILTVCKLDHAGGLLAQTLPAFEIDAEVKIENFNAFRWVQIINKFTHSHLTPGMAEAVTKTKSWRDLDLSGIVITCGSDRVSHDCIQDFINKDCTFIVNWGMSEVGPIAINKIFKKGMQIDYLEGYSLMGDTSFINTKIINNELFVKGEICVFDDWFATGDLIKKINNNYWFDKRKDQF
tara:strand:+ start:1771 stop:2457 length:687 start_codon:yes stop_codon:yes gene_type:complete